MIAASCQDKASAIKGIYKSQMEIDEFDKLWDKEVYQLTWEDREDKVQYQSYFDKHDLYFFIVS